MTAAEANQLATRLRRIHDSVQDLKAEMSALNRVMVGPSHWTVALLASLESHVWAAADAVDQWACAQENMNRQPELEQEELL